MIEKFLMRDRSMAEPRLRPAAGDPGCLIAGRADSLEQPIDRTSNLDAAKDPTAAMANIKSQKKRNLTNAKRASRNKAVKSELKTRVKTATASIGTEANADDVRLAIKRLDKAAAKGIIHPNQAARRKSRLMKSVGAPRA
jgi:small subunit ribosomal protein S20